MSSSREYKIGAQLAIGRAIRRARLEGGISQRTLAKLLRTYPPSIIRWEQGQTEISAWMLLRIFRTLGCDPGEVLRQVITEVYEMPLDTPNVGRPCDNRRRFLKKKYGLSDIQMRKIGLPELEQLMACKSEEARKLLLGITEPGDFPVTSSALLGVTENVQ